MKRPLSMITLISTGTIALMMFILGAGLSPQVASGEIQATPTASPVPILGDYGDAPDSSNNQGVDPNTAYTGVDGHFPTSHQNAILGSATNAPGPLHLTPQAVHLGLDVSLEQAADGGTDGDGVNNIVNGGADEADDDGDDDGWLDQNQQFIHCYPVRLDVGITNNTTFTPTMYLNVWFDGDRSGDWGQAVDCSNVISDTSSIPFPIASEWIVQDREIEIPPGSDVYTVPTFRVPVADETADHWMRFTLSDVPAGTADGSMPFQPSADPVGSGGGNPIGGQQPTAYSFGETEDYIQQFNPSAGEPGELILTKSFDPPGPINAGDDVEVTIRLQNVGGGVNRVGKLRDILPVGLSYSQPIAVNTLGNVSNQNVAYDPARNGVGWNGLLEPDSGIEIVFEVEADYCFGGGTKTVENIATFEGATGNSLSANANLDVLCIDADTDDIEIERRIKEYNIAGGDYDPQANPNIYLPKEDVVLETRITNNSSEILSIGVEEVIEYVRPDLSNAVEASTDSRQQMFISPGASATVEKEISYADSIAAGISFHPNGEFQSTVTVCLLDLNDNDCSRAGHKLIDDPFVLEVSMSDLGDAPDSSNHYGVEMSAYPNVLADFPTVHDPTLTGPAGPIILNNSTLWLGRSSGYEAEADQLPDSHSSDNNIDPQNDRADLEATDNGLLFDIDVPSCEQTDLVFEIFVTQAAKTYFQNNGEVGYLNMWVDGNHDGSWGNVTNCGDSIITSEHIIVNHEVDIANQIADAPYFPVVTTGNVPWDTSVDIFSTPAWVRVMITDRPVDLTEEGGLYSNGGASETPYNFGEIEDYLMTNQHYSTLEPGQTGPIDGGVL